MRAAGSYAIDLGKAGKLLDVPFLDAPLQEVFEVRVGPLDSIGGERTLLGQGNLLINHLRKQGGGEVIEALPFKEWLEPFQQQNLVVGGELVGLGFEPINVSLDRWSHPFGRGSLTSERFDQKLVVEVISELERLVFIACASAAIHIARAIRHLHTAKPGRFFEVCSLVEIDQAITERLGFRDCSLWSFLGDLGWLCS